jgi:ligand-binding sensor protein
MKCPGCGFENVDKARFCNECGARMDAHDPNGSIQDPAGSKFCSECGHSLATPVIPAPGPPKGDKPTGDPRSHPVCEENGQKIGAAHIIPHVTDKIMLRESEQPVSGNVLSCEGDLAALEFSDLIDAPALQELMDAFFGVARIPMSVIDIQGRLLVGAGWQDICTRFHRVQKDSCRNCLESDTHLSAGLHEGEHRLYKCKNNMWQMATPIMVAGRHVGNIFTGQFFFEDETVDYELFRAQAREYGFNEGEYLAALDRVPRMRRETVDQGNAFFVKLACTLSKLGYSNLELIEAQ